MQLLFFLFLQKMFETEKKKNVNNDGGHTCHLTTVTFKANDTKAFSVPKTMLEY